MEKEKEEKGANAREDNKEEDNKKEKEHKEKEDKKEEEQEVKVPRRLDWSGGISKRVICSAVAGGSFILVLEIAVSLSKQAGKRTEDIIFEGDFCPDGSTVRPKDRFKCYYLSVDKKSWSDSQKMCRSLGVKVAIFRTAEETEFLGKRIGCPHYRLELINDMGTLSWKRADGTEPSNCLISSHFTLSWERF
uniref:C-type lectin domain family 2 member D-related protein-like isoform X2 n=1 Tax=Phascolarctos cinereus TaxID=38626 RepID=A0A6P5LN89_PHACI|nr:C-type lectin domain family 2 member D-related protein-like isoform X2 [Phascolarctos cinereus]